MDLGGTDKHLYGGPHLAGVLDLVGSETYGEFRSIYSLQTEIKGI